MAQELYNADRTKVIRLRTDSVGDYVLHANGQREYYLTIPITPGVTTTASASGSWGRTSHATGAAAVFLSNGSVWQSTANVGTGYVRVSADETVAGVKTFSSLPIIPDTAFGIGWNNSLTPPTKNSIYDQYQLIPFKDLFNIKAYGAAVDGVTNDTAAVVAAINAAITAGGGTVYFPSGVTSFAGSYVFDAITTTANVKLLGSNGSDILLGSTGYLALANFGILTLQDLTFIGTSTSAMSPTLNLQVSSNALSVFNNCQFFGLGTSIADDEYSACVLSNTTPTVFNQCFFVGCSSPNAAVVTSRGGAGLRMVDTLFYDIAFYKGVAYSTAVKTAGACWVRFTTLADVVAANGRTGQFVNCTFDEAPLWGIRFNGSAVTRQHSATIDNCHFNTGLGYGGGHTAAIYATEMRQVTVKDTTSGFVNNTTDYRVAEFNNVDTVVIDNFRLIYGAKYISLTGTTTRLNLRRSTLQGNATYPTGVNNAAAATIDTDGGV